MHAVDLISAAISPSDPDAPEVPEDTEPGVCCVTGAWCEATVERKLLLGKSFTMVDFLAKADGGRVGVPAYRALKYKWERMGSWLCDGESFRRLDKPALRMAVLHDPRPWGSWAGYATTSYKKHGALMAPVNAGGRAVWQWETERVDVTDRVMAGDWWAELRMMQAAGATRAALVTLDCPQHVVKRIGAREWVTFCLWAGPRRRSGLYRFLCWLLPTVKELDGCATSDT